MARSWFSYGGGRYPNSNSVPTYVSAQANALLRQNGKTLATETFSDSAFWLVENKI